MNEYVICVTAEERDLIIKMRDEKAKEKAKQEAIIYRKKQINTAINNALHSIGLEDTKRIVRAALRDLRSKTDDPCDNCEQCVEMRNGVHAKCPKTGLFDECEKHPF